MRVMLIALSGGTHAERIRVAEILVASSSGGLVVHAQDVPALPGRWAAPLVERIASRRARLLSEVLRGRSRRLGLVLTQCLTESEAELVRAEGGSVWHLYGEPSRDVVIRRADPMVSTRADVPAHVVEPLEAYSQMILARLAASRNSPRIAARVPDCE
jgi:hypothetical protein